MLWLTNLTFTTRGFYNTTMRYLLLPHVRYEVGCVALSDITPPMGGYNAPPIAHPCVF